MSAPSPSPASESPPLTSPLEAVHRELGAQFTVFGGYDMPVRYGSDRAEHIAVRTAAGIFDLSHMGEIFVRGEASGAFLDWALAGTSAALAVGRAKYNLILDEQGGILDDLIVYRLADDDFLVVANAGNRALVARELEVRARAFAELNAQGDEQIDLTVNDESEEWALIAVQGPNAESILAATEGLTVDDTTLDAIKYYRSDAAHFDEHPVLLARTGYTGEDGFELFIAADHASDLWRALERAGAAFDLVACGLACRDSLRLEAGMPLYGNELSASITPAMAGLGRVVALAKPGDFVGRTALEQSAVRGDRVLVGLRADGRRAARHDYEVRDATGDAAVGVVTSGALSPTLEYPIAMAYVDRAYSAVGSQLTLDVRGTRVPASVVSLPFYSRKASK